MKVITNIRHCIISVIMQFTCSHFLLLILFARHIWFHVFILEKNPLYVKIVGKGFISLVILLIILVYSKDCGKGFTHSDSVNYHHRRIRNGERPFLCKDGGKSLLPLLALLDFLISIINFTNWILKINSL